LQTSSQSHHFGTAASQNPATLVGSSGGGGEDGDLHARTAAQAQATARRCIVPPGAAHRTAGRARDGRDPRRRGYAWTGIPDASSSSTWSTGPCPAVNTASAFERPLAGFLHVTWAARRLLCGDRMRRVPLLAWLFVLSCTPAAGMAAANHPCAVQGDVVVVDTHTHVLWLCSGHRPAAQMKVALGRGGLGKRREGDGRTPLGVYALGAPRASLRFGTFIPIGYPTAEQRRRGFTGKAVGIHGPERRASWLGAVSTWLDWTAGCVATGTDDEIARVAAFVRDRRLRVVLR
jgi:hypothetical protein